MKSSKPLTVEVVRGTTVESIHRVAACVADEGGRSIQTFGLQDQFVYPRSAIKMLQAIPFVESGAYAQLGEEKKFLAMSCASHCGQHEHIECLDQWMMKTGIAESCLVCQGHLPNHKLSMQNMIREGIALTPKFHNCAGKHLGLLSTAQYLKEDLQGYEKYEHPVQRRLRDILTETTGFDYGKIPFAVDGCGVPTYAIPLNFLATGMSVFINPKVSGERKHACTQILEACQKYPLLLSGENELTTEMNQITKGKVVIKVGAEGNYCGLLVEQGLTFALKAMDGAGRAADVACAFIVQKYANLSADEEEKLSPYLQPVILSSTGKAAGKIQVLADDRS